MQTAKLILGLLDTSCDTGDPFVAGRLRELTIAWSRFKYFGDIIEDTSVDAILAKAVRTDATGCLIQAHGHILDEVWHPEGGESADPLAAIAQCIATDNCLVAGRICGGGGGVFGLSPRFLLVDLAHYRALNCPPFAAPLAARQQVVAPRRIAAADPQHTLRLEPSGTRIDVAQPAPGWSLIAASLNAGLPVRSFPKTVAAAAVDLDPGRVPLPVLRRLLDPQCSAPPTEAERAALGERAAEFLSRIHRLAFDLQRGVFIWNIESYQDIERPPDGFSPPLRALYTVAAGFKPNRLLETHGFDDETRMVVFDYSRPGLAFRRLLHETWDGDDYPSFLRRLFRQLPSSNAHYVLWESATPETVDWNVVEARWQAELAAWGGAAALRQHWRHFRRIPVAYVYCDLLTDPQPLLDRMHDEDASLIWWSNAFFSVHSNWRYPAAYRRAQYRAFIGALAARAPALYLYGADSNNISVNFVQARTYREWYDRTGGDALVPARRHRQQIRF